MYLQLSLKFLSILACEMLDFSEQVKKASERDGKFLPV